MAMLKPVMAVLDETDSGLDIDALKTVAEGINALRGPDMGLLLVTHYQRMLNYVKPDVVHVLFDGRIVKTGGPELALELETRPGSAATPPSTPTWRTSISTVRGMCTRTCSNAAGAGASPCPDACRWAW